jgi:hypothetical protein
MRPFLLVPLLAAAALLGTPWAAEAGPSRLAAAPVPLDIHFGVGVGVRYGYRTARYCTPCYQPYGPDVCCNYVRVYTPYHAYYPYSSYRPPVHRYYSPRYYGPHYPTYGWRAGYRYQPSYRYRWSPRSGYSHRVIGRRR